MPITDWKNNFSTAVWMVKLIPNSLNNLSKDSAVDCFQVRSLSEKRMVKKIGEISDLEMKKIEIALSNVLNIS